MKFLIVDDDVSLLALLEVQLLELGHDVVLAPGAGQALAELEHNSGFDLLLTDVRMPGRDGLGLIEVLRRQDCAVPCAVMSALDDMNLVIRSLRLGAIDFLPKPITRQALADMCQRLSSRRDSQPLAENALPQTYEIYQVELPSNRAWVPALCQRVVRNFLADQDNDVRETVRLALHEALMNAIVHGNLEVPGDAREVGNWEAYEALVAAAEDDPVLSRRPVMLKLKRRDGRIRMMVKDDGAGFSPDPMPLLLDDAVEFGQGRGLMLIRHCVDSVHWNESGNQIEMIKLLPRNGSSH